MKDFYFEFTPDILKMWEDTFLNHAGAEWHSIKMGDILPFIRMTMPRLNKRQSIFGRCYITVLEDEDERLKEQDLKAQVVIFGLEPLMKVGILSKTEGKEILDWFLKTGEESENNDCFEKHFVIEKIKYRLFTDYCDQCRFLQFEVTKENSKTKKCPY